MRFISIAFISFLTIFTSSAMAQTTVGRAMVDGKAVILYDDYSWDYETKSAADCKTVAKGLTFCDPTERWKFEPNQAPGEAITLTYSVAIGGLIVNETLPDGHEFTTDILKSAAVINAATAAGTTAEDVLVLDNKNVTLKDHSAGQISYSVTIDGIDIVYVNTVIVTENRALQLMTYAAGKKVTDAHAKVHDAFISYFTVE